MDETGYGTVGRRSSSYIGVVSGANVDIYGSPMEHLGYPIFRI